MSTPDRDAMRRLLQHLKAELGPVLKANLFEELKDPSPEAMDRWLRQTDNAVTAVIPEAELFHIDRQRPGMVFMHYEVPLSYLRKRDE